MTWARPGPSATVAWRAVAVAAALWLALEVVALATRPLLPMDETRYLGVAWEMWHRSQFLVPILNGEPYSDKPPLLFWLMQLGWAIAGVNAWWPRLVAPLFGLGCLALTAALARRLWPRVPEAAAAPLVLMASGFWALFTTLTMFDMVLALFTLVGLAGVLKARREGGWAGWVVFGLAIGLGALAKGPAILLHTLPAPLLAPWWAKSGGTEPTSAGGSGRLRGSGGWAAWYARLGAAVALGAAVGLAWAVPAALEGGAQYRDAILWSQTADRMVESFAHDRPWWWYAAVLPGLLLPATLWPGLWRAGRGLGRLAGDEGMRFCAAWFVPAFVMFSLVSGKQLHYLLPIFPALALAAGRLLAAEPEAPGCVHSPARGVRARDSTDRLEGGRNGRALAVPGLAVAGVGLAILMASAAPLSPVSPPWMAAVSPAWILVAVAAGIGAALVPTRGTPARLVALAVLAAALGTSFHLVLRPMLARTFDLAPVAVRLGQLQREGRPLANYGKYHGQFHFLGRLREPMAVIGDQEVVAWVADHPRGVIVTYHDRLPAGRRPLLAQPFRDMVIGIWEAAEAAADPDLVKRPP